MYALSWKLLIIGLLSEYFANLLKRQYLKKIAAKCSTFLHLLYISYRKVKDIFLGDKDQISLGRAKGEVLGGIGRSPK